MKNQFRNIILLLLLSIGWHAFTNAQDTAIERKIHKVYKFDIKENIAPPVWRTTKMAIEEAEDIGDVADRE
mgnify:CR=1 FL=1